MLDRKSNSLQVTCNYPLLDSHLTKLRKEIIDKEANYDYLKEIFEDVPALADLQQKKKAPRRTGKAKMLKKRAPAKQGDFNLKPAMDEEEVIEIDTVDPVNQKELEEKELRDFVNGF